MSNNDAVLFFSKKCEFSRDLLTLFKNSPAIGNAFVYVDIDNKNVKLPPYVKSVPTALIPINGKQQLLVGKNIFEWFKQMNVKSTVRNTGPSGPCGGTGVDEGMEGVRDTFPAWDPTIINGYSDGFSYLDSDRVENRSFSSYGDIENQTFYNPDPTAFGGKDTAGSMGGAMIMDRDGGGGSGRNDEKKKQFDAQLEQYTRQRDSVVPQAIPRMG